MLKATKTMIIAFLISMCCCSFAIADSTDTYCFTVDANAISFNEFKSGMELIDNSSIDLTNQNISAINKNDTCDATGPILEKTKPTIEINTNQNDEIEQNTGLDDDLEQQVSENEISEPTSLITDAQTEKDESLNNDRNNTISEKVECINLENYRPTLFYGGLTDLEIKLVNDLLDGYTQFHTKQNIFDVIIDERLDMESYRRIVSWFAIYMMNWDSLDTMIDYAVSDNETVVTLHLDKFHEWNVHRNDILSKIEIILKTIPEGTEIEKLDAIAEYLANNVEYKANQYNADDLLYNWQGNCNAFSLVFQHMCLRLGIPSDLCVGYSNSGYHAWVRCILSDQDAVFYDLSFYNSSKNAKYLHSTDSPWGKYDLNNYYYR